MRKASLDCFLKWNSFPVHHNAHHKERSPNKRRSLIDIWAGKKYSYLAKVNHCLALFLFLTHSVTPVVKIWVMWLWLISTFNYLSLEAGNNDIVDIVIIIIIIIVIFIITIIVLITAIMNVGSVWWWFDCSPSEGESCLPAQTVKWD